LEGLECGSSILDGGVIEDHSKPPYTLIKNKSTICINKVEYDCIEVVFVDILLKRHVLEILKDTLEDP